MVGEVRGKGLMACVAFVRDRASREYYDDALDVGTRVADACEPRGVLVRPMVHLNVMSPPLVITRDEIDQVVAALRESIVEVRAGLDTEVG
jgi:adenosylmethionine-8-amino-7-oxononanoate aminotransferase